MFNDDTQGNNIFLHRRGTKRPPWKSSLSLSPCRGHKADVFSKDALVQGLPCPISLPVSHLLVGWVLRSGRRVPRKGKKKINFIGSSQECI